ncbi:hypothetical protein GCM10020254_76990 [Streptomyces goshikiensis]
MKLGTMTETWANWTGWRVVPQRERSLEQVVERGGLAGAVAAPGRFDADLAAQREGVDAGSGGRGDAQPEDERRAGGVRVGAHPGAGEGEVGHGRRSSPAGTLARRSTASKKVCRRGAGLGSAVEAGPQHPHPPDELVTDVDRHQVALGPALGAAQQQRLHVGFEERGEPAGAEYGLPGLGVEFALGGARRARVERDEAVEEALRKKKATPTGIWSSSQAPSSSGCPGSAR